MPYYIFSECTEPSETETDEGNTVYVYCIHILHIYILITSIKNLQIKPIDFFLHDWFLKSELKFLKDQILSLQ